MISETLFLLGLVVLLSLPGICYGILEKRRIDSYYDELERQQIARHERLLAEIRSRRQL